MIEQGALVIQAHPFRQENYIDHIELYPNKVHGVEVINACRKDEDNEIARLYAKHYGLVPFAGTDNHVAGDIPRLAGMCSEEPIENEQDFVERVKSGKMQTFMLMNEK